MADRVLSSDERPAGAGQLSCTALWDLDTCSVPEDALQAASCIVGALSSCLGASMIFASSGSPAQQKQIQILQDIPHVHIAPVLKQTSEGGSSYRNLRWVGACMLAEASDHADHACPPFILHESCARPLCTKTGIPRW